MTFTEEISQKWLELESLGPLSQGERRIYETEVEVFNDPVLLALDDAFHRHLLVPLSPNARISEDTKSQGVHILQKTLVDGTVQKHFLDVVCQSNNLKELFAHVTSDMLQAIQESPNTATQVCFQVLERWREFLSITGTNVLSIEKLLGLYGELWYLREIIRRNPISLNCWKGPEGGQHDLVVGELAIEVKTTQVRHGRFVEIHGHQQLEPPAAGDLYLAVIKVEQGQASNSSSVPDLIDSIHALGVSLSDLASKLERLGYSFADTDFYRTIQFQITENRLYHVDADFPQITSSSFTQGRLPAGIVRLTYQLDLTGEPPHPSTTAEMEQILDCFAGG